MDTSQVPGELTRVVGAEGIQLLQRFSLLHPLIAKMIIAQAIADVAVSDEDINQERQALIEDRGYDGIEQWPQLLAELEKTDSEVMGLLIGNVKQKTFIREQFSPKSEARFLDRKNELDQVVYSLLRLKNKFLAQELYLQIE